MVQVSDEARNSDKRASEDEEGGTEAKRSVDARADNRSQNQANAGHALHAAHDGFLDVRVPVRRNRVVRSLDQCRGPTLQEAKHQRIEEYKPVVIHFVDEGVQEEADAHQDKAKRQRCRRPHTFNHNTCQWRDCDHSYRVRSEDQTHGISLEALFTELEGQKRRDKGVGAILYNR